MAEKPGNDGQEPRLNDTETEEAQEVLKQLALFKRFVQESSDGMGWADLDGNVRYLNPSLTRMLDLERPEDKYGEPVAQFYDQETQKRLNEEIFPQILQEGSWLGEMVIHSVKGKQIPTKNGLFVIRDTDGNPMCFANVVIDMTEHRRAENELKRHRDHLEKLVAERTRALMKANKELERDVAERKRMEAERIRIQKMESIGTLAGGIAHSFNNLLTGIWGNIGLARMYIPSENKGYEILERAEGGTIRAKELAQQLLTFSKGGAPVTKSVQVARLIRDSVQFALSGSNVDCDLHISADLRPAKVDEGQINQVLNNLLLNAIQAMAEGGTVRITAQNLDLNAPESLPLRPGKYILISIQDFGIGIKKEHLAKIFDPYFSTKQQGSGLGLATAYSIINKHNGHICVESEPGIGALFKVYLPASETASTEKPAEPEDLVGKGRILVMDDEQIVREVAGEMLAYMGYEAVSAPDGATAIALYRQALEAGSPFDAVILDLTVPGGMGGKEAIKGFKEMDTQARVVVSSGYSNDPVMAEFEKYGFVGVVPKPYTLQGLGKVLKMILE